jgi:hypothetical protein
MREFSFKIARNPINDYMTRQVLCPIMEPTCTWLFQALDDCEGKVFMVATTTLAYNNGK